ncbi:MAG: Y4bD/Y4pK family protein [Deltaproteobacteria bacterium]|nr:Y4bD/Y4pK family protein [Deltaproteobacteria bacterium]
MIVCRHNWGEYRVYFHDSNQRLISVPVSWTSITTEDPFVKIAAGRSLFRSEDLLRLCNLIEDLEKKRRCG